MRLDFKRADDKNCMYVESSHEVTMKEFILNISSLNEEDAFYLLKNITNNDYGRIGYLETFNAFVRKYKE